MLGISGAGTVLNAIKQSDHLPSPATRLPRPAVGPERSAVERPAVSFCPSHLTDPNKSHRAPLCHPDPDFLPRGTGQGRVCAFP
jgi:hypothetical protein